ncbi:MAG: lipocalin-like domain-containing protein, partial [Terriglobia bacterium]
MKRLFPLPTLLFAAFLVAPCPGGNTPQYAVALPGYHYSFPRDNFNHPAYQTEWWYYTGNLWTSKGRRFGFELTFFRVGVSRAPRPASVWNVNDVYMAHVALSDIQSQKFYDDQRLNRAGPGVAGIDDSSGKIWNGNWQVVWRGDAQELRAVTTEFAFGLVLHSLKAPVIQGINGVSRKAPGRGHASHYISLTRLAAQGTVRLSGHSYPVKGSAWMDHEFFTEQLSGSPSGWDWTCMQFDANTELMVYRLRRQDGSEDPYSSGTYVDAEGHSQHLTVKDFQMQPGSIWTSPETHARYPVNWRVQVPSLGISIVVTTPLKSQELVSKNQFTPTYWEGAIDLSGTKAGKSIHGVGYLELTGYARSARLPAHDSAVPGSHRRWPIMVA